MVLYISLTVVILALTRALAYWGIYFLKGNEITLINGVLNLTYVENTGAAFGIFKNSTSMLSFIGIALFVVITYIAASKKDLGTYTKILMACLAGGGLSNVCDRLSFGYVVDYINFCFINYPVFNLADICVVLSCILLAVKICFDGNDDKNENNNADGANG